MKKILMVTFAAILFLAGCGAAAKEVSVQTDADDKGDYSTVEATFKGDTLESITFDSYKGTLGKMKVQASKDGEYDCCDSSPYYDQITALEEYVVENQEFPTLSAEGKDVDGVSGATITLTQYEEAYELALEESKK